jgi:nucleoside diphosphate kinase
MKDDETGEALTQRPDDTQEAVPKRLDVYHKETEPILAHYQTQTRCTVSRVDANQSPALVWADLSMALKGKQPPKNMAFVFVKPNQMNEKVVNTVREGLKAKGLTITKEGDIKSEQIDRQKLVDQHYYAIASKATILKPSQLNVPNEKFEKQFGISWVDVQAKGLAFNALDACAKLGCDTAALNKAWDEAKNNNKLVKLGGGFYCGLVEMPEKTPIYVFNAFFMTMRSQYTAPKRVLHYFTVEWDEKDFSWADFRGRLLGATDPKDARQSSLRGKVFREWKSHDLESQPNVSDNVVHASASPFEGLCERMNWLGIQCRDDAYGRALMAAGLEEKTIKAWTFDPQVKLTSDDGKKGSVWDALEDMGAASCTAKAAELAALK